MKITRKFLVYSGILFVLCGCAINATTDYQPDDLALVRVEDQDSTLVQPEIDYEIISKYENIDNNINTIYKDYDGRDGVPWLASLTDNGTPQRIVTDYYVMRDQYGIELGSTKVFGSERVEEMQPAIMQYGSSVQPGAVFYPYTTTYGVDCVGCSYDKKTGNGGTSAGISVRYDGAVRQQDGTFKEDLQYEGYYVVAASKELPLCTTLLIEDHGYSGHGLTPGVPFKAIVLDRGGGVNGAHLDLFKGNQVDNTLSINRSVHNPKVTIEQVGYQSSYRSCPV